ncbi:hypothetical protein [Mycobacterium sp.]
MAALAIAGATAVAWWVVRDYRADVARQSAENAAMATGTCQPE